MDPDAIVKLILAISVGFSLVVVSFQIARVFGGVADLLRDLRRVTKNVGEVSDIFLEDYKLIHTLIASVTKTFEGVAGVFGPIASLAKMFRGDKDKVGEMERQEGRTLSEGRV